MKLVIIFGPQAVGKMTVGQELEKITNLKLFHNHMTIELVSPYFSYGTPQGQGLERNKSPNRLLHKPTKRDIALSERDLLDTMKHYRLNSEAGEITHEHYIRIDNTHKSPDEVAKLIQERFLICKLRNVYLSRVDT
ncbi:hypothetical protein [Paenibacillus amylolyticus]|uniref:hypothetical protein n=1 Tax=Paenibacillus amylolyticus TaxID=1451 RepID=UPI003D98C512